MLNYALFYRMAPKKKRNSVKPHKTYQLRSGPVSRTMSMEAQSRTPKPTEREPSVTNEFETGTQGENDTIGGQTQGGDLTEVGNSNPPTHVETSVPQHQRLLGQQLQLNLLHEIVDKLLIKRSTPPPLVPLCRLVPNEILRKVTIQVDEFADSFDRYGYLSTSAPFLLSLHRLRGGDFNEVTSVDLAEWGPSWVLVNDEFENELLGSEWEDLKGRKFLVWDGNHRLKAWLPRIRDSNLLLFLRHSNFLAFKNIINTIKYLNIFIAWSMVHARHVRVRCEFLNIEPKMEGELILAMQSHNE